MDQYDWTPLAHTKSHEGVIRLILVRGNVEVDSQDWWSRTSLSHTSEQGTERVVRQLLARKDIEVGLKDRWGLTSLSHAVQQGHKGSGSF